MRAVAVLVPMKETAQHVHLRQVAVVFRQEKEQTALLLFPGAERHFALFGVVAQSLHHESEAVARLSGKAKHSVLTGFDGAWRSFHQHHRTSNGIAVGVAHTPHDHGFLRALMSESFSLWNLCKSREAQRQCCGQKREFQHKKIDEEKSQKFAVLSHRTNIFTGAKVQFSPSLV